MDCPLTPSVRSSGPEWCRLMDWIQSIMRSLSCSERYFLFYNFIVIQPFPLEPWNVFSRCNELKHLLSSRLYCLTLPCFDLECTTRVVNFSGRGSCRWMGCRAATAISPWGQRPISPCRCPCCSATSSSKSTCPTALKVSIFIKSIL